MAKIPVAVAETLLSQNVQQYLKLWARGKVRDTYRLLDPTVLLPVATDRISIFDFVLNALVPGKGKVLKDLTVFWLTTVLKGLPNHLLAHGADIDKCLPSPLRGNPELQERAPVVRRMEIPPFEFIFRMHLGGAVYEDYLKTGIVAGQSLPPGIPKWGRLDQPLFTPSTKAEEGHDKNIPVGEFYRRMKGLGYAEAATQATVELFRHAYVKAYGYAKQRGVLILDTKFEGFLGIADEVLTPDSSRFTTEDDWENSQRNNRDPVFFDKEFVRKWGRKILTRFFAENGRQIVGINGLQPTNPEHLAFVHSLVVPPEIIAETSHRYKEIYRLLVQ